MTNKNVKIARQLVRLAKNLVANRGIYWEVEGDLEGVDQQGNKVEFSLGGECEIDYDPTSPDGRLEISDWDASECKIVSRFEEGYFEPIPAIKIDDTNFLYGQFKTQIDAALEDALEKAEKDEEDRKKYYEDEDI